MRIMKQTFLSSCLIFLSWGWLAIAEGFATVPTEHAIYDAQIGVKGLCADLPDSTLSLAFKTELESAILSFYQEIHSNDTTFEVTGVNIREKEFIESTECPDVEDVSTGTSTRFLQRTLLYSTIYYDLDGNCYGEGCPEDPSSAIGTSNRLRRKLATKEQDILLQEIQAKFPEVTDVTFLDKGSKINCGLTEYCKSPKGLCCGHNDCGCTKKELTLCTSNDSCTKTKFPACLHDMSCDSSISITPNQKTLAIGSGYRNEEPSVQVYDFDDVRGIWRRRGHKIVESSKIETHRLKKRGGGFGTSISLTDDGMRLATGAYAENSVTIFDWSSSENAWIKGSTIQGVSGSMFGLSLSFSRNPNLLVIGSPRHSSKDSLNYNGRVYVYEYLPEEMAWLQYGRSVKGNFDGERLGWRVALSPDGYTVSASSRDGSIERSFEWHQSVSRWIENDSAPSFLPICERGTGNDQQCQNTFL